MLTYTFINVMLLLTIGTTKHRCTCNLACIASMC